MDPTGYQDLLSQARFSCDLLTLAFAGVIGQSLAAQRRPLIRGLSESRFKRLLNEYFPQLEFPNGIPADAKPAPDEFDELLGVLLQHRLEPTEQRAWLSYAIASAATGGGSLWRAMGLPSRAVLFELLRDNFPRVAAANVGDAKWNDFFCRELCEPGSRGTDQQPFCAPCADREACFPDAKS